MKSVFGFLAVFTMMIPAAYSANTIAVCQNYTLTSNNYGDRFAVQFQGTEYAATRHQVPMNPGDQLTDFDGYSAILPGGSIEINVITSWYDHRDRVENTSAAALVSKNGETITLSCQAN